MPDHAPPGAPARGGLQRINAMPPDELRTMLAACLDIDRWVDALLAERPYASAEALLGAADRHARGLTAEEVAGALARHPRIGERAQGKGTEAAWSRKEQSGMDAAEDATREALREGNAAYERRFGHIYLVCATGRSSADMLADLQVRLGNDPETEAGVVADELRKIALTRVEKLVKEQKA